MTDPAAIAETLVDRVRSYGPVAVALSGGVDSAVVAAAAARARGDAIAVTAASPSVAAVERRDAAAVAAQIGIRHRTLRTDEFAVPEYRANRGDRCYFCKSTLFEAMQAATDLSGRTLVSGTNADDLGDYRPGLAAAAEAQVRQPLAELGIDKATVRALATRWGLAIAAKPASPCLASRIAVGVEATPERVAMVEQAEAWLRERLPDGPLRVRVEADDLARIEVPAESIATVAGIAEEAAAMLTSLGFRATTLDLGGFRSGSLNALVPLEMRTSGQSSTTR